MKIVQLEGISEVGGRKRGFRKVGDSWGDRKTSLIGSKRGELVDGLDLIWINSELSFPSYSGDVEFELKFAII